MEAAINIALRRDAGATVLDQPRALGAVGLTAVASPRGTELSRLRQSGSLKLLFPRSGDGLQAVLLNTAGGITGGDAFEIGLRAEAGARVTVSTQAAERAYRAQDGQTGRLSTHISIAEGGRLNWMPQETLLYEGCALRRSLRVDVAPGAAFLMVEPLVFGRAAMGEALHAIRFEDRVDIRLGANLAYADRMLLRGDVAAQLDRPAVAAGARALATLVYVAQDAEARLGAVRALLSGTVAGASLLRPGVLVLRMLAADSHLLRGTLIPVLIELAGTDMPPTWMF